MNRGSKQNATDSTKAIAYQFCIALEKCFELNEGQSVIIEYYGDVSISGKTQIEVKNYKRLLSNLDQNFWKTLKNWMEDEFPRENFQSYILCTTQQISLKSEFLTWNEISRKEKLEILKKIFEEYQLKKRKDKKTLEYLNYVMSQNRRENLNFILDRFTIQSSHYNYQDKYKKIKEIYSKPIPKSSQEKFINSLIGFIISPKISNENKWEVSYNLFITEVQELTKRLKDESVIFPEKIKINEIKNSEYMDSLFVKKIKKIDYFEVIAEAISDYIHTNSIAIEDFKIGSKFKQLQDYKNDIHENYKIKYRFAKRNASQINTNNSSKDFYDNFLSENPPSFSTYNTVPSYFRRGLIHNMANSDKTFNIKWNLDDE